MAAKPEKKVKKRAAKKRHNTIEYVEEEHGGRAEDLADFTEYIASDIFEALPKDLRTLCYSACQKEPRLADKYADPLPEPTKEDLFTTIPPSAIDSLSAYSIISSPEDLLNFINPILQDYIAAVVAPPPVWSATRAAACEICERDYIPLSYHHLIPKQVHAKALKRGWHEEWELNKVAWLCRACHSFVHRVASNEDLAKDWWSVERLMGREDVQAWKGWVGRVRWKAR